MDEEIRKLPIMNLQWAADGKNLVDPSGNIVTLRDPGPGAFWFNREPGPALKPIEQRGTPGMEPKSK